MGDLDIVLQILGSDFLLFGERRVGAQDKLMRKFGDKLIAQPLLVHSLLVELVVILGIADYSETAVLVERIIHCLLRVRLLISDLDLVLKHEPL